MFNCKMRALKNKNVRLNSLKVVFCYILELENFANEIRNPSESYLEPSKKSIIEWSFLQK